MRKARIGQRSIDAKLVEFRKMSVEEREREAAQVVGNLQGWLTQHFDIGDGAEFLSRSGRVFEAFVASQIAFMILEDVKINFEVINDTGDNSPTTQTQTTEVTIRPVIVVKETQTPFGREAKVEGGVEVKVKKKKK